MSGLAITRYVFAIGFPRQASGIRVCDTAVLNLRQQLSNTLIDWYSDPISGNLLAGVPFQEAASWLPSRQDDLTQSELEFIQGGNNVDDTLRYTWGECRAWAATSRILKARITSWGLLVLALTLAGAVLGTMSESIGKIFPALVPVTPWLAAVALGLATYLTSQILNDSERQAWVKARALAEGLKSECYKYVTAAAPYNDRATAAGALVERVIELQRLMAGVIAETISPEDRAKNIPDGPWTVDQYVVNRVREQIDRFYRPAIAKHQGYVAQARMFTLVFGAAAVLLSASSGSTYALVSGTSGPVLVLGQVLSALLGIVTTAAAAIAAWFQSGHHQQLAQGYQAAVTKLELLLARRATLAGDPLQVVVDAEAVFQAEHAAWLAEWQAPTQR
jgi:hypothetical protein